MKEVSFPDSMYRGDTLCKEVLDVVVVGVVESAMLADPEEFVFVHSASLRVELRPRLVIGLDGSLSAASAPEARRAALKGVFVAATAARREGIERVGVACPHGCFKRLELVGREVVAYADHWGIGLAGGPALIVNPSGVSTHAHDPRSR